MIRAICACAILLAFMVLVVSSAEAYCASYTDVHNGDPANASQVMDNFHYAALTSGITIDALTATNGLYVASGADGFRTRDSTIGVSSAHFL